MNQIDFSQAQQEFAQAKSSPAVWTIVSQVKSNRIVYFTDDVKYQPHMEGDWYYCSSYIGVLPVGITLQNCWSWRFNGGTFTEARETVKKSKQERIIESNRKALLQMLREKIDEVRSPFMPSCALGQDIRKIKMQQALCYLNDPETTLSLLQLQTVAVARNMTMLEAAKLITAKSEEMDQVLLETERFREQLTQAILHANSESQLWEIREWLLDKVYPELTKKFKFQIENTEPPNLDVPLRNTQRLHEIVRLKVQLREAINKKRSPVQSGYIQNDEIRKHKALLAQAIIKNKGVKAEGLNFDVLDVYANGRGLSLIDAAKLISNSMNVAGQLLIQTEQIKDRILARIETIQTLRDIGNIEQELEQLSIGSK